MQRNVISFFLIFLLIFFVNQGLFGNKDKEAVNNSQITETNSVTTNIAPQSPTVSNFPVQTTTDVEKAADYTLSSPKSVISFSNVGGSLHNVDFVGNNKFPLTDILSIKGLDNAKFDGEAQDDKSLILHYSDQNWQVTKSFEKVDENLIKVRVDIKNVSEISNLNDIAFTAFEIDETGMDLFKNGRESALFEYSINRPNGIFRKGSAYNFYGQNMAQGISNFFKGLFGSTPEVYHNHDKSEYTAVKWIGFRDHYHAFIVKPAFEAKGYAVTTDSNTKLNISFNPANQSIRPGESQHYDFDIYAGPQNTALMKSYHLGFEKIFALSNFIIIEWIGQGIYYTIPFFHSIFKSWGFSIILISLLIYGITYPLTLQSMMSMRKMQEVQPKMNALKERYKNDPQRLNTEMMEIYRREKINPFGGCLPFLIQMPFFMALYQVLWRAQYFQGQGFLWIKDLTQPDRLIMLPISLPIFGNEINILPILTGGLMFLQQKVASKNMVATDEQQIMQQKMMMFMLPCMMTLMFYRFASSWALYFMIFYILSTLAQLRISKATVSK